MQWLLVWGPLLLPRSSAIWLHAKNASGMALAPAVRTTSIGTLTAVTRLKLEVVLAEALMSSATQWQWTHLWMLSPAPISARTATRHQVWSRCTQKIRTTSRSSCKIVNLWTKKPATTNSKCPASTSTAKTCVTSGTSSLMSRTTCKWPSTMERHWRRLMTLSTFHSRREVVSSSRRRTTKSS